MKLFKLTLFLLLFIAGAAGAAKAQTVDYDGLRFTALPDLPSNSFFGYSFVRVLVTNSSSRERSVRLFMKVDYSRDIEEISRRISIAPAEVREESLMLPVSDFSSSGVRIEVDGMILQDVLAKYHRTYRNFYAKKQALIDAKIPRNEFDAVFASGGALGHMNLEMNQFEGSNSQLYRTWLGYSQFNILIFYAATLTEMPEAVRRAVFDYVRAGGVLLTIGGVVPPDDFVKLGAEAEDQQLPLYEGGFGKVITAPVDFFASGTITGVETFDLFSHPEFKIESPLKFNEDEIETVSARWLMMVVYLFAFLIGPVNVYILHRMGRKILVFLTVPVASVICCSIIYGYYIIFESSTLLVKRQSLTLLNEKDSRAITLANYSIFSARSRAEGFHYDMDTEVYPVTRDDYRSNDAGKFIVLDEDQHFNDGWVKPKVPRYLHLRAVQTRRERISLTEKDGGLELMNGLGADVEEIHLMTRDGRTWTGADIAAGSTATLKQLSSLRTGRSETAAEIFVKPWFAVVPDIKKYPLNFLRSGGYVARLKSSPFLRQKVDEGAELSEEACVIGLLKEEPQS